MWEGKVTQNRLSPDFKSPKAGIYDTDFFILLHSKRKCLAIGHFTVIDGSEAEGDLVLIQTFFALL